jgi:sugar lactone lactonase YvrE
MQTPKLFKVLPDFVATPDGMAIHPENGDLILACPNYADQSLPGCILRIDAQETVRKWVDLPVHEETGLGSPMGIAFGPNGDLYVCDNQGWPGEERLQFKGRILRLTIRDNQIASWKVVASGMEHPNGMRIRAGHVYVTQSLMTKVKDPSGLMVSAVYRFGLDEEGIEVSNTLADRHILTTVLTENPDCQYGLDGIEFDRNGDLLVGNFGDGAVHRISFNADGTVASSSVWAKNPEQLQTTDGFIMDAQGNLYIADFFANAVAMVSPDATVRRIAQSPDCDGLDGGLNQPGEPCIWNGRLIVTCFDLVTGPNVVDTGHSMPATLSELVLE